MYKIGERLIEIHNDVINKLKLWNTTKQKQDRSLDSRFALTIFLSLSTPVSIANGQIDQEVMNFITGKFRKSNFSSSVVCQAAQSNLIRPNQFLSIQISFLVKFRTDLLLYRVGIENNDGRIEAVIEFINTYCDEKKNENTNAVE